MTALPGGRVRGTLQPSDIDALKCELCDGWFAPTPDNFGCPWCPDEPPPVIRCEVCGNWYGSERPECPTCIVLARRRQP